MRGCQVATVQGSIRGSCFLFVFILVHYVVISPDARYLFSVIHVILDAVGTLSARSVI